MAFRPRHLSVSSVALYAKCPAQFRQRYVDRLVTPTTAAQATGTAFHKALEAEHRGQDSERAWIDAANAADAMLVASGQTITMSKVHGLELLNEYRRRGLGGQRGEPERKFLLPFPSPRIPVPLLGYIDLPVPSERHFRDFKTTGMSYWTQAKVDLEPQKEVYGWAYQRLYRHRPEYALWVVFNTQQLAIDEFRTVSSPDGFRLFERQAEGVWQGIVEGRYEPCGECTELCKPPQSRVSKGPQVQWEESAS